MHRDSLRNQWMNSLYKMNGLTTDQVHEISSSQELYDIANGYDPGYDVYLMTHATFRAGLKRIGDFNKASKIPKVLGIGLKIIDEAHLEFRDTLIMDFIFNVKRNLYLTATDGRSSKSENAIFKHVFENTTFYKPSSLLTENTPRKWVEYNVVAINTHAKASTVKYKIEGFRGMSAVSYGKFCIQIDKNHTHFKCCRDILKMVFERDPSSKVLVFLPLIDLCTEATYFFIKSLNYDKDFPYDLNIKTINSHNSKQENEDNRHADVIVTTIGSCGTGTDIPGITTIISCTPIVSKVNARQIFGRIRYCGKPCYYYDLYDESVKMDKIWLKVRAKVYSPLATKTNYITWEDDPNETTNT